MWGRAWVPGAWEVNCTVCPPSGDNNSQSVIINQREKQEGTAETEEAAKCTESAEKMEKGTEEKEEHHLYVVHLLKLNDCDQ